MTPDINPLLAPWDAPYGLPPFAEIRAEHFAPAFEAAWRAHRDELDRIAADPRPPDFDNTVAAFDASGERLAAICELLDTLGSSHSSEALRAVERDLAGPIAAHDSAVSLHRGLFARIDAVHAQREALGLDAEQRRLVERIHLDFVRAGARLPEAQRARYAAIVARLAELQTSFAQNVLADEEGFRLALHGEAELAGLPDFVRDAARQAAIEAGPDAAAADPGLHLVTLSYSLVVPFLAFSARRDLREQAWRAWTSRGEHDGPHDNRPVAREILALRRELARHHAYDSYADYALADTMAGDARAVRSLLEQVWTPARRRAAQEEAALSALARELGEPETIEPWDWRYLAEKLRQRRYAIDESAIKPYFSLERIVEAAFDCAARLFGLRFVPLPQAAGYHPDVHIYEVHAVDAERGGDRVVGLFLQDNFARPGKRSGAWMGGLRWQSRRGPRGAVLPLICNNNNFARGRDGEPTLLSFDDAVTLFHEFGHGLHGLLSDVGYQRLSGPQVLRDFVELPSQLFEHWVSEPEVLRRHARHVETGEPIPDALVQGLRAARHFNQGFETVRYAASALVDLAVHQQADPERLDIVAFERAELAALGAPQACGLNHRLPHFQHLFSDDGYAAGYYVYLWAEVLEADAFEAFTEAGDIFEPALAARLHRHVYASGDSVDPAATYRAFRGRDAGVGPMLRKRGLVDA